MLSGRTDSDSSVLWSTASPRGIPTSPSAFRNDDAKRNVLVQVRLNIAAAVISRLLLDDASLRSRIASPAPFSRQFFGPGDSGIDSTPPRSRPSVVDDDTAAMTSQFTLITFIANIYYFILGLFVSLYTRIRSLRSLSGHQKTVRQLQTLLSTANTFEEWQEAAEKLDVALGKDVWRKNPISKRYDYRMIQERLEALENAREEGDVAAMVNLLRSGELGPICLNDREQLVDISDRDASESWEYVPPEPIQTKLLIEDYIRTVMASLYYIAGLPISPMLPPQTKLDILHDTRSSFGRTSLVLQGGAIFGLYHIGVVKALLLRNLLPRIITGTGVGALIAALVCIHTDAELPGFLCGEGIDLSAFAGKEKGGVKRKLLRILRTGYLLDIGVIEKCVRANVGDLTFEEAYQRTKRVLNITLAEQKGPGGAEIPGLLNHITTPNVLIYTAACASNATGGLYKAVELLCKDHNGVVVPYTSTLPYSQASEKSTPPQTKAKLSSRNHADPRSSPHARVAELFNVNHFIISQARPYIAPFISPAHTHSTSSSLYKLLGLEIRHRLQQIDTLGLLPTGIRKFLIDEVVPGSTITVVPDLNWSDFEMLVENPNRERVGYWVSKGEKSVWPMVAEVEVRCGVEFCLERIWEEVRSRQPGSVSPEERRRRREREAT
ncbi:hypothetical protein H072_11304 [Dactylellina haptotyla CBS 200.50]|uniref:PNPLA domain-containing protein n=1 Tax=Dactylellina haptotyla (strain CBS 200.50) TaxID=1284197 RepID=S7ZY68_DACHA|nr:hypothetical protein H072_11304 [Dactylellina haptotyla CBS 200.50]